MDWQLIKKHAYQLDAVLKKQKQASEVDSEIEHMMLTWCYCDARWIADMPKEQRKEALLRVHELFRDDVKQIATMIVKGEIP